MKRRAAPGEVAASANFTAETRHEESVTFYFPGTPPSRAFEVTVSIQQTRRKFVRRLKAKNLIFRDNFLLLQLENSQIFDAFFFSLTLTEKMSDAADE